MDALVAEGVLGRVPPDRETAMRELDIAHRHLSSVESLAETDPSGAFALGYDAVRKSLTAHMRVHGIRARSGGGQHERIGRYALAAFDRPDVMGHLERYDTLRRLRNRSQYDGLAVEPEEVEELLVHARAIVAAVAGSLGRGSRE